MLEVDGFSEVVGREVPFDCLQEFQVVGKEVVVVGVGAGVETANDKFGVPKKAAKVGPVGAIDHEFNSKDSSFVFRLVRRYQWGCCYLI